MTRLELTTADFCRSASPRTTDSRHVPLARPKQSGFTILELLAAIALIVLVMSIANHAFSAEVKAFRELVAVGDMDEQLRSVASALADDITVTQQRAREFIPKRAGNRNGKP